MPEVPRTIFSLKRPDDRLFCVYLYPCIVLHKDDPFRKQARDTAVAVQAPVVMQAEFTSLLTPWTHLPQLQVRSPKFSTCQT